MAGDDDQGGGDAAAEAFEEVRAEVTLLRRAIERLAAERAEVPEQPDYSETLGRMSNNITAIAQRVDILTKGSAQAMTPDHIAGRIVTASIDARRNDQQIIAEARAGLDQATRQLAGMTVSARRGDEQNRWLTWTAIGGIVVGMMLWGAFGGTLARVTPDSWLWPERLAARTLGGSQWDGARRLAAASYPETWNDMLAGVIIGRGNQAALERCQKAATKAGESVRCTVRIAPAP
ncbi:DUF6118 family protein [uncultured Sphingomonas sp.]|uniref:DUF6118 family protein n=1 Tax=uncultured Sphingomonas sp. TaxID=158754 RepID=UPI0035CB07E7